MTLLLPNQQCFFIKFSEPVHWMMREACSCQWPPGCTIWRWVDISYDYNTTADAMPDSHHSQTTHPIFTSAYS